MTGKIIAFEGLDCSFKETNYKEFVRHLVTSPLGNSRPVIIESFPRYGNQMTIPLEKWLDGSLDRAHLLQYPAAIRSLYAIDRLSYWREGVHGGKMNIAKYFNSKSIFVFDRYSTSNCFYNPTGFTVTANEILAEEIQYGTPTPNIVIWMRMHSFETLKRFISEKENKDANELDFTFLKAVWDRSEQAIQSGVFEDAGVKLVVIECLDEEGNPRTKEEIAKDVWNRTIDALKDIELAEKKAEEDLRNEEATTNG